MEKNILRQTLRKKKLSLLKNKPLLKIILKKLFLIFFFIFGSAWVWARKNKPLLKIILKTLCLIVLFTLGTVYVWLIIKLFAFFAVGLSNLPVHFLALFFKGIFTDTLFIRFMEHSALLYAEIFCYFIFFIFVSKILSPYRSIKIAKNLFLSIIIIGLLMTITSFIYIKYIGNGVIKPSVNNTWLYWVHALLDWRHRLLGPNAVYFYDIPSTMKVKSFFITLLSFYPMLVFLTKYLCSKKYFYLLGAFGWWLNCSIVLITNSEINGWYFYPLLE